MGALRRRLANDDGGSTLLLTIFYCFLGLSIVVVVALATTLYLERKRLFTVADGAALAAAEAWRLETVRLDGDRLAIELDSAEVRAAASALHRGGCRRPRRPRTRARGIRRRTHRDGHAAIGVARASAHRARAARCADRGDRHRALGVPLTPRRSRLPGSGDESERNAARPWAGDDKTLEYDKALALE